MSYASKYLHASKRDCLDLLTYNRGSDDVWDRWANLTKDKGWAWNSVEQYYLKVCLLQLDSAHIGHLQ